MDITVTTPALLFPAISLLLLAFTNRYLTLAGLVRDLHARIGSDNRRSLEGQIANLRRRIYIIRNMQIFGVGSFFLCVVSMLALFLGLPLAGKISFAASLLTLLVSLGLSLREIGMSVGALKIQLDDCTG
jgi:hypothetical protein